MKKLDKNGTQPNLCWIDIESKPTKISSCPESRKKCIFRETAFMNKSLFLFCDFYCLLGKKTLLSNQLGAFHLVKGPGVFRASF